MTNILRPHSIAIGLFVCCLSGQARADFLQPSTACPGAVELVEFDPSTPGQVLEVRIPSGATATCNMFPALYPVPRTPSEVGLVATQIVGDGSNITFVNNVAGIEGETPIFEAVLTGTGHTVTNNGDLFLLVDGDEAEVSNTSGFMTGLIEGDDVRLHNDNLGVILGLTLEGERARVTNDGAMAESAPAARGILVIGADAKPKAQDRSSWYESARCCCGLRRRSATTYPDRITYHRVAPEKRNAARNQRDNR